MATTPEPREKTFDELRLERAREWQQNQSAAAKAQAEFQATIMRMPDVANAPSPDIAWTHPGLVCRFCQNETFHVERWITVNGVRHRAELHCLACQEQATWDWTLKRWIEDVLAEERAR